MLIYVVKRGDTLYKIGRRFGVSAESLTEANQLQNPSVLAVGQSLVIPVEEVTHMVQRGQSVTSIANSYGIGAAAILAANPATGNGNLIYPGQVLRIPLEKRMRREIIVNGYATNISAQTLAATLPYLTFLSPFSYRSDENGDLTPTYSVSTAQSAIFGTANLLTLTNLKAAGGFSSAIAHAIFTDATVQQNFLRNVLQLLDGGDWYGVNLDFEYVYPFDKGSYNQFLRRIADLLHPMGYIVVTALAPKVSETQLGLLYSAHDYAFHGAVADYVVLMTYEWGYTYGPAMAVAPIDQVRRVLDYAVSVMPAGKILMGIPNYGYNWTLPFRPGTAAKPLSNIGAVTLAGTVGAEIRFDTAAQSPYFNFTDSTGVRHEVWFEDARSLRAKYALADEYGLGGVSFWNLNSLFRTNFLVLESMYGVEKVDS